jgi:chromatin segregation and condensation protein Rec8/ScpA/Scc1 (kleisin family)
MDFARKLTYRFLSLSYYIRIKIALDLGLILDEDKKLDDEELLKQVFRRAKESNKLKELWDKIEEAHGDNSKTSDQSSGKEVKEG